MSILKTSKNICLFLFLMYSFEVFSEDEYFGTFNGEPSLEVQSNSTGRPTFILLKEFIFTDPNGFDWVTPKGWEVDGASIPQVVWSIVGGPMSGKYLHASIIHDRYCDTEERTAHDTHRSFYYGMLAKDVSISKAKIMYWAVRTFGPSWKITKKPISHGIKDTKYVLEKSDVKPPTFSDEATKELVKNLDSNLSLAELDLLSDSLRKSYGSEGIQTKYPTLKPGEGLGNIEQQLRMINKPK